MSIATEIAADIASGTDFDDLFQSVTWGVTAFNAMIETSGVIESYDIAGGPRIANELTFKFRRTDLVAEGDDLSMFGDKLTFNSRVYDVNEVDERPGWPMVVVRATLRN